MAKGYVKIDASNFKKVLANFQYLTGKTMPEIVRSSARICAVELANRTQPFTVSKSGAGSVGKEVLTRGTGFLKKDIARVIRGRDELDDTISKFGDEELRARLTKYASENNTAAIAKIFTSLGIINSPGDFFNMSGNSEMEIVHRASRSKITGHTLLQRKRYYYAQKGLDSYVKIASKKLGYTKGGWATCARLIGGVKGNSTRGIPSYATRHNAPNGRVTPHLIGKNPYFVMTNTTPWLSRMLPPAKQREAVDVAGRRMVKFMETALREAAKKNADLKNIMERLEE